MRCSEQRRLFNVACVYINRLFENSEDLIQERVLCNTLTRSDSNYVTYMTILYLDATTNYDKSVYDHFYSYLSCPF